MQKFSFWFSIFALFVSINVLLMTLTRDYPWARDALYTVSIWSVDKDKTATLRLYGVLPVSSCYMSGASVESNKRCVIGRDRYMRFHKPSEKSEG